MPAQKKKPRTLRTKKNATGANWTPRFLRELAGCGVIGSAAKHARIARSTVYERIDADPEFAAAVAEAIEENDAELEATGRRRAKTKSDKLLIYFLKRRHDREANGSGRRNKLHLHLHMGNEEAARRLEALPDADFEREYQAQVGAVGAHGGRPEPPGLGMGEVPA